MIRLRFCLPVGNASLNLLPNMPHVLVEIFSFSRLLRSFIHVQTTGRPKATLDIHTMFMWVFPKTVGFPPNHPFK